MPLPCRPPSQVISSITGPRPTVGLSCMAVGLCVRCSACAVRCSTRHTNADPHPLHNALLPVLAWRHLPGRAPLERGWRPAGGRGPNGGANPGLDLGPGRAARRRPAPARCKNSRALLPLAAHCQTVFATASSRRNTIRTRDSKTESPARPSDLAPSVGGEPVTEHLTSHRRVADAVNQGAGGEARCTAMTAWRASAALGHEGLMHFQEARVFAVPLRGPRAAAGRDAGDGEHDTPPPACAGPAKRLQSGWRLVGARGGVGARVAACRWRPARPDPVLCRRGWATCSPALDAGWCQACSVIAPRRPTVGRGWACAQCRGAPREAGRSDAPGPRIRSHARRTDGQQRRWP